MGLEPNDVSQDGDCDSHLGLNRGATKCATLRDVCDETGSHPPPAPPAPPGHVAATLANLTPDDIARLTPAQRSQLAALLAGESSATPPAGSVLGDSGDVVADRGDAS